MSRAFIQCRYSSSYMNLFHHRSTSTMQRMCSRRLTIQPCSPFHLQCLQSSLAQDGGANLRPQCSVKVQKTLKTLIKRSQELPEIFEIVLGPIWWVAGSEQPSPPLHRAAAARLLRRSHVLRQYFFPPSTPYFSMF